MGELWSGLASENAKNAQVLNTLIATNCYGFGIEMRWEFCTYDVVRKPKMTFEKTDLLW